MAKETSTEVASSGSSEQLSSASAATTSTTISTPTTTTSLKSKSSNSTTSPIKSATAATASPLSEDYAANNSPYNYSLDDDKDEKNKTMINQPKATSPHYSATISKALNATQIAPPSTPPGTPPASPLSATHSQSSPKTPQSASKTLSIQQFKTPPRQRELTPLFSPSKSITPPTISPLSDTSSNRNDSKHKSAVHSPKLQSSTPKAKTIQEGGSSSSNSSGSSNK